MIFFSGESVPVMKSALPMSDFDENDHQDNYDTERHKRHTLFSGELTNSYLILMSGSCHLDEASNVEIGVECQIFVIVIKHPRIKLPASGRGQQCTTHHQGTNPTTINP